MGCTSYFADPWTWHVWEWRYSSTHILNLRTTLKWVLSNRHWLLYCWGKCPHYVENRWATELLDASGNIKPLTSFHQSCIGFPIDKEEWPNKAYICGYNMSIPSSVSVSQSHTVGQQKGGELLWIGGRDLSLKQECKWDLHPQFTYTIGLDSLVMQVMWERELWL
jgi:hypothetical protein